MSTHTLVERTALSGFTLRGLPVVKGQIVALDPDQLASLADAGCVARSAEANARVPVADLPALQPTPSSGEAERITTRLEELRASARDEATRLDRALADARAKSADDIAGIERSTTERLESLGREVAEAEQARDARLREISGQVEAARVAADEAIAAEKARAPKGGKSGAAQG